MTTEMMRLQGATLPLINDFKAGLGKYASALVEKGQGVKKPPQCFNPWADKCTSCRRRPERYVSQKFQFLDAPHKCNVFWDV